jgi:hypothetical protein
MGMFNALMFRRMKGQIEGLHPWGKLHPWEKLSPLGENCTPGGEVKN